MSETFLHPGATPLPSWLFARPFAHRGLHDGGFGSRAELRASTRPENTLAAFEAAVAAHYPIELDVQRLGDGSLVVFHDENLERATGTSSPLAAEDRLSIQRHSLFGTAERIPFLEDVLALVGGRVPLLVEIKNAQSHRDVAPAVCAQLRRYDGPLAVQSFNPYTLGWFRKHAPVWPLGQLAGPLRDDRLSLVTRLSSRSLLTAAISRPDFINYDLRGLPDAWVGAVVQSAALPLLCWTVRDADEKARAERLHLNYVFENVRP